MHEQGYTTLPVSTVEDLLTRSKSLFKTQNRLAIPFICQLFFLIAIGIFISSFFKTFTTFDDYLSVLGGIAVIVSYYVLMFFSIGDALNYNQGTKISDYLEGIFRPPPIMTFNVEQFQYERSGKNTKPVVTLKNKENLGIIHGRISVIGFAFRRKL